MEIEYEETGINTSFILKLSIFFIISIGISLFISSIYFNYIKQNIISANNSNSISIIKQDVKLKNEIALKNIEASIKAVANEK